MGNGAAPDERRQLTKTIALPRLNNLHPTLESTALKLLEEAGELGATIGKFRALSGEPIEVDSYEVMQRIARELLDVAQTAVTMMFVLEEEYDIDLEAALEDHLEKLVDKRYLVWHEPGDGRPPDLEGGVRRKG